MNTPRFSPSRLSVVLLSPSDLDRDILSNILVAHSCKVFAARTVRECGAILMESDHHHVMLDAGCLQDTKTDTYYFLSGEEFNVLLNSAEMVCRGGAAVLPDDAFAAFDIFVKAPFTARDVGKALRRHLLTERERPDDDLLDAATLARAFRVFEDETRGFLTLPETIDPQIAARLAHRLVSSASVLGFPVFAKACQAFETAVIRLANRDEAHRAARAEAVRVLRRLAKRSAREEASPFPRGETEAEARHRLPKTS